MSEHRMYWYDEMTSLYGIHFSLSDSCIALIEYMQSLAYSILWAARTSANLVNYNPICIHFELSVRLKSFGPKKLKSRRFDST